LLSPTRSSRTTSATLPPFAGADSLALECYKINQKGLARVLCDANQPAPSDFDGSIRTSPLLPTFGPDLAVRL
jgi:hypothetical protein